MTQEKHVAAKFPSCAKRIQQLNCVSQYWKDTKKLQRGTLKAASFSFQKKNKYKVSLESYSNLQTKGKTTSPLVPRIIGQHYRL